MAVVCILFTLVGASAVTLVAAMLLRQKDSHGTLGVLSRILRHKETLSDIGALLTGMNHAHRSQRA